MSDIGADGVHNISVTIATAQTTNVSLTLTVYDGTVSSAAPVKTEISRDYPYSWTVPASLLMTSSGVHNKTFRVSSVAPLEVMLLYTSSSSPSPSPSSSFTSSLVLISPVTFLKQYYVIDTSTVASPELLYDPITSGQDPDLSESVSFLAVVAVEADVTTVVTVKFPNRHFVIEPIFSDFSVGSPRKTQSSLEQYEALYLRVRQDVSGTMVEATHKVAVFAGNIRRQEPTSGVSKYTLRQTMPADHIAMTYVTLPSYHDPGSSQDDVSIDDLLRILSVESDTTVQITSYISGNSSSVAMTTTTINIPVATTIQDALVSRSAINVITSDKPIVVSNLGPYDVIRHLPIASDTDTCVTSLLPLHLWSTEYRIQLPKRSGVTTWQAIDFLIVCENPAGYNAVADQHDCGLTLNGESLNTLDSAFSVSTRASPEYSSVGIRLDQQSVPTPTMMFVICSSSPMSAVVQATGQSVRVCCLAGIDWTSEPTTSVDIATIFATDLSSLAPTGYDLFTDQLTTSPTTPVTTATTTDDVMCSCVAQEHNITQEEIDQLQDNIKGELELPSKSTSAYRRTLISADDDQRPSSAAMGYLGHSADTETGISGVTSGSLLLFPVPVRHHHNLMTVIPTVVTLEVAHVVKQIREGGSMFNISIHQKQVILLSADVSGLTDIPAFSDVPEAEV
ncbi:cell wall protein RBR3-like [Aplysia californica]|uniref:Cell wall protein RBR3-like n=1 Tax=Aplysia californica TaxID=6500 RepID=A0ABM0ZWI7_APLCA|nr:cell wall protein RBR3-like [Aplysia californica]